MLNDSLEEYAVGSQKIVTSAEMQFINAYDEHMRKVYKEMDYLHHKAELNNSNNMKQQILHKMETRAAWF